jgi:hypothetical protein
MFWIISITLPAPTFFCGQDTEASSFWKGVKWAARAAKMGLKWKVGNGKQIRFWEDV